MMIRMILNHQMIMIDDDYDFCEIDLSEACTLEDAEENGNDTVTEETADVGVNGHLKSNSLRRKRYYKNLTFC